MPPMPVTRSIECPSVFVVCKLTASVELRPPPTKIEQAAALEVRRAVRERERPRGGVLTVRHGELVHLAAHHRGELRAREGRGHLLEKTPLARERDFSHVPLFQLSISARLELLPPR